MYGNILEWDDSAGKEAFNNAKSRFWAKINHLPCDILLPDPNIHIDAVDWDAAIEPELYLDLEKKPPPSEEDSIIQEEKSLFLSEALLLDPTFSCTGWGDAEDLKPEVDNCENQAIRDQSGWGDYSNEWGNNLNQQGSNYYEGSRNTDGRGGFGTNTRWRNDGSGWINSRYKASRFAANEYQADRGYRGRRKKANVAHDKHPLRQWNMKPCAPVS